MSQFCNAKGIMIIKRIGAYLFLYVTFMGIFYDFAYDAWVCPKPIGLLVVLLKSLGFLLLYALVNHILIKKVLGLKTVVIFETILFVLFFVLINCYAALANRFHGIYSA